MSDETPNKDAQEPEKEEVSPVVEEVLRAEIKPMDVSQIATASSWCISMKPHLVRLPSGSIVKAIRVDGTQLLVEGVMTMEELTTGGGTEMLDRLATARRVLSVSVKEPRVAIPDEDGNVPDGAMPTTSIPASDAFALFGWCMNPNSALVESVPIED